MRRRLDTRQPGSKQPTTRRRGQAQPPVCSRRWEGGHGAGEWVGCGWQHVGLAPQSNPSVCRYWRAEAGRPRPHCAGPGHAPFPVGRERGGALSPGVGRGNAGSTQRGGRGGAARRAQEGRGFTSESCNLGQEQDQDRAPGQNPPSPTAPHHAVPDTRQGVRGEERRRTKARACPKRDAPSQIEGARISGFQAALLQSKLPFAIAHRPPTLRHWPLRFT